MTAFKGGSGKIPSQKWKDQKYQKNVLNQKKRAPRYSDKPKDRPYEELQRYKKPSDYLTGVVNSENPDMDWGDQLRLM